MRNVESRATEAVRQAQATQQELTRSQAGVKGKWKGAAVLPQQQKEIGAFASKYQPHPFEGEDDKLREWTRVSAVGLDDLFGGALAEIYEHFEGHRDDSATILDLASLRFEAGLVRNSSTEAVPRIDHVDKWTSTTVGDQGGRAGGAGSASSFSSDDMNQVPTVTTVSKLVDLLATTFSGELMDSLTDFDRRVTSCEHEA